MHRKLHSIHFLFVAVLLNLYFVSSYQQICKHQDQSTLLAFNSSISTSFSPILNWSYAISCCQWEGVCCDDNGRVTRLELPSRGLKGVITSIRNLASLTHLNLSYNDLHGPLEAGIVGLINLRNLDLSSNSFSGPIPQGIGKMLYLERVYLSDNNLSGPIPTSVMNCTNLVDIIVSKNHLDGNISKLDFSRLVQLQKLDLRNNSFNGNLPDSIYSCKSLIAIGVSMNNLSGQISTKIVQLKSLSFLSLSHNSFTNITRALGVLANCKNLSTLFLGFNFYGESLPSDRNFVDSTGFPKLVYISLSGCKLIGSFPKWINKIKTLRILQLNENKITGRLPHWLGTLPNLFSISLSNNSLFGEIPSELFQLPAVVSTNLGLNFSQFHSDLPIFVRYFNSSYNQYTSLRSSLYLSDNKLSGHIPLEIGKLINLQELYLRNNNLSGHIPVGLSNLKKLEHLDLSKNNLVGGIPTSLENLHFLSYLDMSYNDLQGQIPTGGQFATFDESRFEGNPGLCGEPLLQPCYNTTRPKAKDRSLKVEQLFLDGFFVGVAMGFSIVLTIVASYVLFNICKEQLPPSRSGKLY